MSQNESLEDEEQDDPIANLRGILSPDILSKATALPIASSNNIVEVANVGLQTLYWYLPPADKAFELRALYYSHAAWM
jgi:hypothetical protein